MELRIHHPQLPTFTLSEIHQIGEVGVVYTMQDQTFLSIETSKGVTLLNLKTSRVIELEFTVDDETLFRKTDFKVMSLS